MLDLVSSILNEFILCLLNLIGFSFTVKTINENNDKIKKINSCILYFIALILTIFAYKNFNNLLRPITIYVSYTIVFKKLLNIKISSSVITCFIAYIVCAVSEIVVSILVYFVFRVPDTVLNNYILNKPIGGTICLITSILIAHFSKKLLIKLKNIFDKDNNTNFMWITIITLAAFLSLYINNNKFNINFLFTTVSCLMILFIILFLFKEIIDKNELKVNYDKLFDYTENTESLLTKYQKYNHENKNQLILIKGSLGDDGKTKELIDEILEDDVKHTDKWLDELKNIPTGGLKGLLSYKINNMMDKNVNVYISISPRLKDINMHEKINMKTYKELCQMIGVYIDNAYEASIETKKKSVSIEMYLQGNKLNMVIANTFKKKFDLSLIDKAGYSTKGRERGIGLSLVKDIVEKNSNIKVKREVLKNYYYQYITVEI